MVRLKVTTDFDADSDGKPNHSTLPQSVIESGLKLASNDNSELIFET